MQKTFIFKEGDQVSMVISKKVKSYIHFMECVLKEKGSLSSENKAKLERRFFQKTNVLLRSMDNLVMGFSDKSYGNDFKKHFREALFPWMCKGKIVKRGYEKPRGYPGDYLILEMIYNKKDITRNILGQLIDRYLLEDSYVIAVRNRKEKMKELLLKIIVNAPRSKKLRILNIASGGARDVRELVLQNRSVLSDRNLEIVLVDQDNDALAFSKQELDLINSVFQIHYLNENIGSFFRNKSQFKKKLGKFDVVYSIGLIDYIPDLLLEELIRFSFRLLNVEGVLFFAVKNTRIYKSLASDWFCGWNFYLRDQEELILIVKRALVGEDFKIQAIDGFDKQIAFVSIKRI